LRENGHGYLRIEWVCFCSPLPSVSSNMINCHLLVSSLPPTPALCSAHCSGLRCCCAVVVARFTSQLLLRSSPFPLLTCPSTHPPVSPHIPGPEVFSPRRPLGSCIVPVALLFPAAAAGHTLLCCFPAVLSCPPPPRPRPSVTSYSVLALGSICLLCAAAAAVVVPPFALVSAGYASIAVVFFFLLAFVPQGRH